MEEISLLFLSCKCLLKILSLKFIPLRTPTQCSFHRKKHYRLEMHALGPCQWGTSITNVVLQVSGLLHQSWHYLALRLTWIINGTRVYGSRMWILSWKKEFGRSSDLIWQKSTLFEIRISTSSAYCFLYDDIYGNDHVVMLARHRLSHRTSPVW